MSALPPGSRIGRFEISGLLGEGAMGVVYLAHDPQIERPVAIKTLRLEGSGAGRAELESRFLKEAKLAGRLQHPNVVTIYEAGRDGALPYIAMEYVDGDPLTRFLGPAEGLTLAQRVEVIREAALALAHAHERGVLHRDVKPGNILLTRDRRVKVADFGIGKLLSGAADLTRTGQMIGSPAYMSPEQIRGEKLDGRSDFFSLGVVFYELLTGVRPFPGDSITTLVYQILHTEPRDPLAVRADLPPAASEVFARLLAKSPDRRPASAAAFLDEVRRIADQVAGNASGAAEPTLAFPALPPAQGFSRAGRARPTASTETAPPWVAAVAAAAPPADGGAGPAAGGDAPGGRRARAGIIALFVLGALVLAIAFAVSRSRAARTDVAASPAEATPEGATRPGGGEAAVSAPAASVPEVAPTLAPLPTAGPAVAADAVVGAPRGATAATRSSRPTAVAARDASSAVAAAPATDTGSETAFSRESAPPPDNVYRTRRYAKFGVSPDQARMYVDGRYVGIADDWDDRGGGRKYEFTRAGAHHVRFELPGHRDLNLEIIVTPSAGDDTADVGDELKRESRVPYPKLGSPAERSIGPVVFEVDPPDAVIAEGSRTFGPASAFGSSSPLKLSGPMVHDLVLSAPGRKSKTVRILVGPSADNDVATVKTELKKE